MQIKLTPKFFSDLTVLALVANIAHAQSWGDWQAGAPLPTNGIAKTHSIGLELNGTIFVLGGPPWMNQPTEDPTVYSIPASGGAWTEEIGFDGYGGVLGQGGGIDNLGRIIIFGGDDINDPGGYDKLPFEWNQIEGPWHDHAARGVSAPATNFAFCTDQSNLIYSFGGGPGESASPANPNSTYCERFIGSADVWETITPMPIAVSNAAATYDGLGHILIFGGIAPDGSTRTNEVLQYTIATNSWSSSANIDMPIALSDHQATLGADGRVYILGGSSGPIGSANVEQSVYAYDPSLNQWAIAPSMIEPRRLFASFLGSDDQIYVIGGENLFGAAAGTESIYTTPCPIFVQQPITESALWLNTTIGLSAQVTGGGTLSYQWMHNGIPLVNGPSVGGGMVSGALTSTLNISSTGADDAGLYRLEATNQCGSILSDAATITIRIPPEIPTNWTWTSLHPSYANHSYAKGVDNGMQVGTALYDSPDYLNLDHPILWEGTASSAINLTHSTSPGGSILDISGDMLVGWWWAPIQCYVNNHWQTCYYRRAARWTRDGTFYSTNYSGFEYTLMSATDGQSIVGNGADDFGGDGVIWQAPSFEFAHSITPSGVSGSSLSAVDGEYQYGSISLPFAGVHAGAWQGSGASFIDMHPDGFFNSTIVDASDGQQVGIVNQWNDPHAIIWTNSPESIVDLNPDSAISSGVTACESGLQIGTVNYPDDTTARPGIWAGNKDTFTDLSSVVPSGYLGLSLAAIDVSADGTISIVGSSWNSELSRAEAILITSQTEPLCTADFTGDGTLDFFDISAFLLAFSAGNTSSDMNNDGVFDFFDISVFLNAFNLGCP